jgi:MFS family permease
MIIQGAGVGFIPAAPNVYIADGTPRNERAVGYATVTFFSRFSQFLFAPLFGIFAQVFGLSNVFFIGGLISVSLIFLFIIRYNTLDKSNDNLVITDK